MVAINSGFWSIALVGVVIYCVTKTVQDFRAKRYIWAIAGLLAGVAIPCVPIKSQAIKVDLPAPNR
jgi:hypothetical protein